MLCKYLLYCIVLENYKKKSLYIFSIESNNVTLKNIFNLQLVASAGE